MKQTIATLLFALFFSLTAFSQSNPVKWSGELKQINGQEFEMTLTANMQSGWYIYSQYMEEGGPVPTKITFFTEDVEARAGADEKSNYRKEGYDELFEMDIIKFAKEVKFVQKITIPKGATTVTGQVMYMSCDDEQCLPPKRQKFTLNTNDVTFSLN